jgi:hypothetical protein
MLHYLFDEWLPAHPLQGLFLTARWSSASDFQNAHEIVKWCVSHKLPIYILGPVVEYDAPLPKLLAYSIAFQDPNLPQQHMRKEFFDMDRKMKHIAEEDWKVHYVSLIDAACPHGNCLDYADAADKTALMSDDNHLSNAGSMLVIQKVVQAGELPAGESRGANGANGKVATASATTGGS